MRGDKENRPHVQKVCDFSGQGAFQRAKDFAANMNNSLKNAKGNTASYYVQ